MKADTQHLETYSSATIIDTKSQVVVAYITADIHSKRTPERQAEQLLYPDFLLSGTKKYSREEFLDAVNVLGASININVNEGIVTITLKSTKDAFPKLLRLVNEMLETPAFSASQLKRVQKVTINELKEAKDDSKALAKDELQNKLYTAHDRHYSYSIDTTIKTVESITVASIKALHKTFMRAAWTVSVAGTPATTKLFTSTIETLKKKHSSLSISNGTCQQKPQGSAVVLHNIPSKQNIDFSIGTSVPITLRDDDFLPLQFALAVLGWPGFAGRLMSTVREKEGYTYGIYAKAEGFYREEQGYYRIFTFFAPDKVIPALKATYREISKLYKTGVSEAELAQFKRMYTTKETLKNDAVQSRLNELHVYALNGLTVKEIELHKARIQSLTTKEVNAVIRKYLNPKHLVISGAGPVAGVKKDIEAFFKTVS